MADSGQAFQGDTAIYRALAAVGVDTPIVPPLTSDEGGPTPSSEYSLHFEVALGAPRGQEQAIDVGFGFGHSWFGHCGLRTVARLGLEAETGPRMLFISSLKSDSTLNPPHRWMSD